MNRILLATAAAAVVLAGAPALAHHSFAMFDQRKIMTLEGVVTEFQWTNPHSFIEMDVTSGGRRVHWSIELNSPNNLRRQLNPLRNGVPGGLFLDVRLADGRTLDSGLPKDGTPVNVPQL
ncbi:MAG: hypothetical protein B7Z08_08555 [Sphingomonadales bacterium 32-68-7]|nr:MAG: hypothetical protein B7Z08_08555 [Sphingomonadales bacterium 32-68-7]